MLSPAQLVDAGIPFVILGGLGVQTSQLFTPVKATLNAEHFFTSHPNWLRKKRLQLSEHL